jgi:hypothetical protein
VIHSSSKQNEILLGQLARRMTRSFSNKQLNVYSAAAAGGKAAQQPNRASEVGRTSQLASLVDAAKQQHAHAPQPHADGVFTLPVRTPHAKRPSVCSMRSTHEAHDEAEAADADIGSIEMTATSMTGSALQHSDEEEAPGGRREVGNSEPPRAGRPRPPSPADSRTKPRNEPARLLSLKSLSRDLDLVVCTAELGSPPEDDGKGT